MSSKLPKQKYSDLEYVSCIKNESVQRDLANVCFDYYFLYYKKVVHMDSWKVDIFQDSFSELWLELTEGDIYISNNNEICHKIWKTGETRKLECSLLTYFMSIAKNIYLAKFATRREISMTDWQSMRENSDDNSNEDFYSLKIAKDTVPTNNLKDEVVGNSVDSMSTRCRQILTLFYWEALSLDEILEKIDDISTKDALKTKKSKCMLTLEERVNKGLIQIGLKPYTKQKKNNNGYQ